MRDRISRRMLQAMSLVKSVAPFTAMITMECTDTVITTLSKAAMAKGMSNLVFIVYSNVLATLLLLPFIILPCRSKQTPLSFSLVCGFFLLGLNGTVGQILAYTGLKYSSPALLSAMASLIPILTFLLAVIFRMEKLDLKRISSKAKCLGTIVAVSGAFIITFYKGPLLINSSSSSSSNLLNHKLSTQSNWVFGALLFAIVCLLSATWNIAQTTFVHKYPEKMVIVFFFTFFVALQTTAFSVIMERNPEAWKLKPDIEMAAIVTNAILGNVVKIGVHTWALQKKGPVYVAMFKPLGMVVSVVLVVTFLGETLSLGSVVGSLVIAVGFYTVIWGKMKEQGLVLEEPLVHNSESSDQSTLLLRHSFIEELPPREK